MSTTSLGKIIVPGVIGNALEWYDFSLYGYFAPIMAHLFFPAADKTTSLLATFTVFAMGFLMRPLGALLFGHFGDRRGRKQVLAAAVIIMALATAFIGILPIYAQIGSYAGFLLMLCRLLQGLAIGGEFAGSIVYIIEHAPARQRGYFSSLAMMSTTIGLLLGSAVAALVEHFVTVPWAWRIPFLLGLVLGLVGLYLRLKMPETPYFNAIASTKLLAKKPLLTLIKQAPVNLLKTIGLDFLPSIGFYLLFIYLSSYLNLYYHIPLSVTLTINSVSLLLLVFMTPLLGYCSDYIGRKKVMFIGALSLAIFSYPLFLLIAKSTLTTILIAQLIFAVLISFCAATLPAMMAELYPTKIRYSGVALPYNLTNTFLGGTAPLVVTFLIHETNSKLAPSFYLILAALVLLFILTTLEETHLKKLSD